MKERPILFNGEMVRAILDGRKTQTRRVIKKINPAYLEVHRESDSWGCICPLGTVGDRLWVRETFTENKVLPLAHREAGDFIFRADLNCEGNQKYSAQWRPSIHMPRWASRITLEITNVKIERLENISEEDSWKEGFPDPEGANKSYTDRARYWFKCLWNSTATKPEAEWESNPWVWVIEFRRVEK